MSIVDMATLFTIDDMLLGVLIAAVVLLVKSLPLILARVSFGYMAYWYVQHIALKITTGENIHEDDFIQSDRRLNIFRGLRNSLKKNIGLYDESLASSFILLIFYLGGYFHTEVSSLIIVVIIASVIITAIYYWVQNRLYAELNRSILNEIRIE